MAWVATTIRRTEGEVNVVLGAQTDNKGWGVHHLPEDPDMPLASMVNSFSQAQFKDLGLQVFQEILRLQAKDVIQLLLALIQHPNANQ